DRGLEGARQVHEIEWSDEFLEIPDETVGRELTGVCQIAESLERLLVGWEWLPVRLVRRKIRAAVVGVLNDDDLRVSCRERLIGAKRVSVVQPRAAAHDR